MDGRSNTAGGSILPLRSVSCWQLPRLVSRHYTLLTRFTESQWSERRAVRLMIRSTAQQRHCCCLRKQVPQQSGQHADLVNCAQRAWKKKKKHEAFRCLCQVWQNNLCSGTEGVRMAPRRKTVTDRGHLKQGVGSVLFYSVINVSIEVGNGTLWRRLATIWTSNKFYGVKLSVINPLNLSLFSLQSPNYERSAYILDFAAFWRTNFGLFGRASS